ncbi:MULTISPECIES: hypothetical protein [unclassified Burkholderia]|uniref:hypothetical protein n=1 Tax=unclassified Burkholderia TaxID=2613784 RepID=UPI00163A4B15|nr:MULTISPECIES: hypothetical protein [unclassified Burkholderia]
MLVREALARAKTGDSFKRLARVLSGQAMPHAQLAQWIIAHDGLPADACAQIAALAGRSIDFIEIDASTGDYGSTIRLHQLVRDDGVTSAAVSGVRRSSSIRCPCRTMAGNAHLIANPGCMPRALD